MERNQSLDLIKIIAMIMVIGLHVNIGRLDNPIAFVISRTSGIAIPLFFMVSGFLLWGRKVNVKYSLKKIFNILKFSLLVCFAYWLLFDLRHGKGIDYLWSLCKGCFIQQERMGVLWYLGAMLILYALLPIINYLDSKYRFFIIYINLILLSIIFVTFTLNLYMHFEQNYIIQTFRIWNWLFYFSLGGIIKESNSLHYILLSKNKFGLLTFLFCGVFVLYVYYMKNHMGGIEYYFGTPLCWLYASSMFIFILSLNIKESKIIKELSNLFLPVYVIHITVIKIIHGSSLFNFLSLPLLDFILVSIICIIIGLFIMRIPYINRVFKI